MKTTDFSKGIGIIGIIILLFVGFSAWQIRTQKPAVSEACTDDSITCLSSYYKNLVAAKGADAAFADIKQRYGTSPQVAAQCHPLMHVIGNEASRFYDTVSQAYLHGDSFCWSGYYHGVMEGVIGRIGMKALPDHLNTMCADIPGKEAYSFDYYNCVHGLGHGIMEVLGDELFKALAMCDTVQGSWEQQSCYGGVFMENIIRDTFYHDSKYLKEDDPMYPCNAVDVRYKEACYLGQTSYALQTNGYDFPAVFTLCSQIEDPFGAICYQSLGRDAANQGGHQAAATKSTCLLSQNPDAQANCVIGAVKEIISYYHADNQARDFCAILDEPHRATCLDTAQSYYQSF